MMMLRNILPQLKATFCSPSTTASLSRTSVSFFSSSALGRIQTFDDLLVAIKKLNFRYPQKLKLIIAHQHLIPTHASAQEQLDAATNIDNIHSSVLSHYSDTEKENLHKLAKEVDMIRRGKRKEEYTSNQSNLMDSSKPTPKG
jgi:hypothetical protein